MKGLSDDSRPGAPRRITDAQVEAAVTQTLESLPPASTHWSTRSLAAKVGLSQSAVVRGTASVCSRIGAKRSSCPPIHGWWRKCETSWACI
jgi:hypothetical protein